MFKVSRLWGAIATVLLLSPGTIAIAQSSPKASPTASAARQAQHRGAAISLICDSSGQKCIAIGGHVSGAQERGSSASPAVSARQSSL